MSLERPMAPDPYEFLPPRPWFEVTSTDLVDGRGHAHAPRPRLRRRAEHLPPAGLVRRPEGTKGYVVTCFDPDAPTGCGFWHWSVVDMPASVTELARGAGADDATLPGGFHARTDFGSADYGGAAPPQGDHPHRYMFVVHAMDVEHLGVDAGGSPVGVAFRLAFHTLARARITVTFAH